VKVFASFFFSLGLACDDVMLPNCYGTFILVDLLLMCILHQKCSRYLNNQILACVGI
jgi:hypothetical protein